MNLKNPGRKIATALCAAESIQHESICIALNAVDGNVPEWVDLIPAGPVVQGKDHRTWTIQNPDAVVTASNNYAAADGAVLDVEHGTQLRGGMGEPVPACGWFTEYRLAENGAVQAKVDWTDLGKGYVSRREYRFISVAFDYDYESREIFQIIGGGLTNNKNLRVAALNNTNPNTEENMDPKLLAALGITPSGTPATDLASALNAIQKLQNDHTTALNAQKDLVPRKDLETALNAQKTAEDTLAGIKAAEFTSKVETAVNAAVTTGKVIPATKQYHLDTIKDATALNAFESTYGKAPEVVDGKQVVPGAAPETETALNAAEKDLGDVFGNSAADLKKYGGES